MAAAAPLLGALSVQIDVANGADVVAFPPVFGSAGHVTQPYVNRLLCHSAIAVVRAAGGRADARWRQERGNIQGGSTLQPPVLGGACVYPRLGPCTDVYS